MGGVEISVRYRTINNTHSKMTQRGTSVVIVVVVDDVDDDDVDDDVSKKPCKKRQNTDQGTRP